MGGIQVYKCPPPNLNYWYSGGYDIKGQTWLIRGRLRATFTRARMGHLIFPFVYLFILCVVQWAGDDNNPFSDAHLHVNMS